MTIKLITTEPPPTGEGQLAIFEINLPAELTAGSWITGSIRCQNVGETDTCRLLVITEWNGLKYEGINDVPAGTNFILNISEGLIIMPEVDAVIIIEGQHLEDGVWVTDDTKSH